MASSISLCYYPTGGDEGAVGIPEEEEEEEEEESQRLLVNYVVVHTVILNLFKCSYSTSCNWTLDMYISESLKKNEQLTVFE